MSALEKFTNLVKAITALVVAGSVSYAIYLLGPKIKDIDLTPAGIHVSVGYGVFPNATFVPEALGENDQVQFWTPSPNTKEAESALEWEKIENDDKLNAFADELMKSTITGYRRYEVIGAGRGGRKAGMWWVVTLNKNSSVKQLLEVYNKVWKPGEDSTYMEVVRVNEGYPLWASSRSK